jgi:hypothetical protein
VQVLTPRYGESRPSVGVEDFVLQAFLRTLIEERDELAQSDETGWYITEAQWLELEGRPWLWVVATLEPKVTLCRIAMSRGGEVIAEVLGSDFSGALATDGWAGHINLPYLKGHDTALLALVAGRGGQRYRPARVAERRWQRLTVDNSAENGNGS